MRNVMPLANAKQKMNRCKIHKVASSGKKKNKKKQREMKDVRRQTVKENTSHIMKSSAIVR